MKRIAVKLTNEEKQIKRLRDTIKTLTTEVTTLKDKVAVVEKSKGVT